jgi:hypothetical protein
MVWGILFLSWLPIWLAYFPGAFSYDAISQLGEHDGLIVYTSHHPPLHTLFLGLCFDLGRLFGSNEAGLVAYALIQMLLLSFILSYSLWRLERQGLNRKIKIAIILFYALYPVISVMSFIPAKEVLFGGFFVLFTVLLMELYRGEKPFWALAVVALLLCFFRNNALHALIISLLPLVIICRKFWRQILLTLGGALLVYSLISSYGYKLLGIISASRGELLSIPMQQMAAVSIKHGDSLSDEEKQAIAALLPIDLANSYNPRFADPIKKFFDFDPIRANPTYYARTYIGLFWKYPLDYLDAALNLNLAYWYPDASHPDAHSQREYIETEFGIMYGDETAIARHSLIPPLFEAYQILVGSVEQQKSPVLGFVFNIGAAIWLLFFGMVLCFVKGRSRLTLIFWPLIAYWLTHLAGPVANLRYMLPLIMCAPICLGVVLQERTMKCVFAGGND